MPPKSRILSIELFKSLGIIYLICIHNLVWMFIDLQSGELRFPQSQRFCHLFNMTGGHVLGMGVPLLAGTTFYLSVKVKQITPWALLKRIMGLFVLGILVNILTWGVNSAFDWDVLPFIAVSMAIAYPFIKESAPYEGTFPLLLLGLIALAFADSFPWRYYENSYWYVVVFGSNLGIHYWALCPWFMIFAAGLFLGEVLLANKRKILLSVSLVGAFLLLTSLASGHFYVQENYGDTWAVSLFKPSPYFVLGIVGFHLMMIPAVHLWLESRKSLKDHLGRSFVPYFGRGILWTYCFNIIVGFLVNQFIIARISLNYGQSQQLVWVLVLLTIGASYLIGRMLSLKNKVLY